jgi:hypothetical protein
MNDYCKSAFPHYKDEITRLRYVGIVSANRLKDARAHLGNDIPVKRVETVQDLKQLVEYAETNRCARAWFSLHSSVPQHAATCRCFG